MLGKRDEGLETNQGLERTALLLATVMLLEAVGLRYAPTETLGAVIGLFATAAIACIVRSHLGKPR
jgi:hypothetical protein